MLRVLKEGLFFAIKKREGEVLRPIAGFLFLVNVDRFAGIFYIDLVAVDIAAGVCAAAYFVAGDVSACAHIPINAIAGHISTGMNIAAHTIAGNRSTGVYIAADGTAVHIKGAINIQRRTFILEG